MDHEFRDMLQSISSPDSPDGASSPNSLTFALVEVDENADSNIPEVPPEPLSFSIDLTEMNESATSNTEKPDSSPQSAIPDVAPYPLSFPFDLVDLDHSETSAVGHSELDEATGSVLVNLEVGHLQIPEIAPSPLSWSIEFAEMDDTAATGELMFALVPLLFSIDLTELDLEIHGGDTSNRGNIPTAPPSPVSVSVGLVEEAPVD